MRNITPESDRQYAFSARKGGYIGDGMTVEVRATYDSTDFLTSWVWMGDDSITLHSITYMYHHPRLTYDMRQGQFFCMHEIGRYSYAALVVGILSVYDRVESPPYTEDIQQLLHFRPAGGWGSPTNSVILLI